MKWLLGLWRFSRPHTIIGTTLSLLSLWLIARGLFRPSVADVFGAAMPPITISITQLWWTWLACITANIYIVGLNQLTDVELDRINKPELPLASGAWTRGMGTTVVLVCLLLTLVVTAWLDSYWLWWTVGLSLALGTVYSLPPFRLKRFHFWAAFCIIAVRSLIVNLALFAHVAQWQSSLLDLPPLIWLLTVLMFAYSVAIAWFKDLPDDRGDAAFGVGTLTVQRGKPWVLQRGAALLGLSLVATILVVWLSGRFGSAMPLLAVGHAAILAIFSWRLRQVDLSRGPSIRRFYLWLWALFFLEYIVFAAAAWL